MSVTDNLKEPRSQRGVGSSRVVGVFVTTATSFSHSSANILSFFSQYLVILQSAIQPLLSSARNENVEVPVYFLKAKQGCKEIKNRKR
jgi:hypothetical protein